MYSDRTLMIHELGREATLQELAAKMKMTEEEIKDIMKLALDALTVNGEGRALGETEDDMVLPIPWGMDGAWKNGRGNWIMKLYIIRHGQTDWNVEGKIQGRQDIPLNDIIGAKLSQGIGRWHEIPPGGICLSPEAGHGETAEL